MAYPGSPHRTRRLGDDPRPISQIPEQELLDGFGA
jgi:hypothetical protein